MHSNPVCKPLARDVWGDWQAEDVGAYSLEINSSSAETKALETGECRASLVIIAFRGWLADLSRRPFQVVHP